MRFVRLVRWLSSWWVGLTVLVVILAVDATWRHVAPLVSVDAFVTAHRALLLGLTIALAAVGVVGLVGGSIHLIMTRGPETTCGDPPGSSAGPIASVTTRSSPAAEPFAISFRSYRFWGRLFGFSVQETDTFSEIKNSWRTGAWLGEVRYLRVTIMIVSFFLLTFGAFGILVVASSPMGIKVVLISALIYMCVRFAWAMKQA
jgi:hypothetical protein